MDKLSELMSHDGIGCIFLTKMPSYRWHAYIKSQIERSGDGDFITDFHTGKIRIHTVKFPSERDDVYQLAFTFPKSSESVRVTGMENLANNIMCFAFGYFAGYGRAENPEVGEIFPT